MSAIPQQATLATPLHGPGAHHTVSIFSFLRPGRRSPCSGSPCAAPPRLPLRGAAPGRPRRGLSIGGGHGGSAERCPAAPPAQWPRKSSGSWPASAPAAGLLHPFFVPVHGYRTLPARSWYHGTLPGMQQVPSSSGAHDGPWGPVSAPASGLPAQLPVVCPHARLWRGCLLPTARMFFHASKVCMSLYARLLHMWGAARCADAGCDGDGGTTTAVLQCSPVGRSGTVPCPSPLLTAQEVPLQPVQIGAATMVCAPVS